ncbi:FAR1-related protein [Trifolium medium]|uniref:FAR1-related protein n=2 Tax=Trifolium TaxID=3898 RepID=A0A392N2U8_9FABA|nr:FAR1-related protein [Trifolium medium]
MSESHEDQIGLEVVPNNDECDVGIPVRTRSKGRPKGSKAKVVVEVVSNNDECDVGNPVRTKSKGRPKRSRPKGGVEAATKIRHCLFPNCGATGHDTRNCPNKRKHNDMLPNESPNVFKKGWRNSSN